jgi:hypothetical protein
MISYSTNWMGPINEDWIAKHGTGWCAGRIDIQGEPDNPWGSEYGVAPMRTEDWNALSDYLWDLRTDKLLSYEDLIEQFEEHYGKKIRWVDES